ncbi:MAG: winged helix-turn-helix transcriptional regulator [Methanobacteriota archaeon]|nr:MAG: winged helix-turn-helix transcriptional regulator [Euryarchaeota archaeon]
MRRGGLMGESVQTSRERVLALVAAQPGLHLRELPRRLGLSLRSVRYHLENLEEHDLVTPHRSGRFARWFAAGAFSMEDQTLISALRVRGQRTILSELFQKGPMRFAVLERATGLSSATLVQYLHRLSSEALIEVAEDRRYRLRDPGAIEMRLSSYRERFPDLLADAARQIFDEK